MKSNIKIVISILTLLIALGTYWFTLKPTISPQDVELKGQLREANLSPGPKFPGEEGKNGYAVEISLDKKVDKPLFNSKHEYLYTVYVYVEGLPIASWDFYKGLDKEGEPEGKEDYSIGGDSRTAKLANLKLKELLGLDYNKEKEFMFQGKTDGFTYTGNSFPAKIRFYILTNNNTLLDTHKLFLIYSHYEIKWGKNLSWVKIVPINFI